MWSWERCMVSRPIRSNPENVHSVLWPSPKPVHSFQDTAATPVGVLPPVCAAAYGANQPTFNCYALQPELINPSKVQS